MKAKLRLAFIDVFNDNYHDFDTIGTTTAHVQNLARELAGLEFEVFVFSYSDLSIENAGVVYQNILKFTEIDYDIDVIISVDSVTPFSPWQFWALTQTSRPGSLDQRFYDQLQRSHQLRIVWLQQDQIWGDAVLEPLTHEGYIDLIVTANDAHTTRITRSIHQHRRMPEVLKSHIVQIRNGLDQLPEFSEFAQKDRDLYVYSQRCESIVQVIWPQILACLPKARLACFDSVDSRQRQQLLKQAGFSLWPGTGTDNHSVLESQAAGCVPIGTRSDSIAESGSRFCGFYLDRAVQTHNDQKAFVDLVVRVAQDSYLLQQHHYAGSGVRELATWATVALEWKQAILSKSGRDLSQLENERFQWLIYRRNSVLCQQQQNSNDIPKNIAKPQAISTFQYRPLRIAIVDLVGMSYSGDTLNQQGLGGSESAVIQISKELVKLGLSVTVFNACDEDQHLPGIYNGVEYCALSGIADIKEDFDVVISSRTPAPFATDPKQDFGLVRAWSREHFAPLRRAPHRIVWMHDTFSWGDQYLETLVRQGLVTQIWCLSDFHFDYVASCDHGSFRNYEYLKNYLWITRNGIGIYDIPLLSRDPNLFIFNANQSKGLAPLLNSIWPRVEQQLPDARLMVIGGHYDFGSKFDNSESNEFANLTANHRSNPRITFTGIITQQQVAEWSAQASYFIYPAALPETFGISTWEALYQGTPLITCRFGALEETATQASWFVDYPVVPNGLYPHIDHEQQADKFVDLVVRVYNNTEATAQARTQAQQIHDIAGWDTVALEWKQHLYQLTDRYLTPTETQTVAYSLSRYQLLTGRRYRNRSTLWAPKHLEQQSIAVITPFRNAAEYLERCILSVAAQNYTNYHHYLIDDASTDNSIAQVEQVIGNLPDEFSGRFTLIENDVSHGAVYNQVTQIRELDPETIIILLDGDDWLANRPDIFEHYNWLYHQGVEFTYGSAWSEIDQIPLVAQPYPDVVKQNRSYRKHRFTWGLPYTHLRTFRQQLIKNIPDAEFQDNQGEWYRAGGDGSLFYSLIERCDPKRIHPVTDIVYCYNDCNPLNDYKVNAEQQNKASTEIAAKPIVSNELKRILIAVPTAKYIEPETFKSIYDQIIPAGYKVDFQYFYGYRIDQVRNLIAHWACQGYDYLWAIDSDISFPSDTLSKLLAHDKDMISGLYRQRKSEQHLEIYFDNGHGGVRTADYSELKNRRLMEIAGCGFGCVLLKSSVLRKVGAPQFEYHVALDHNNTVSEDLDFCTKVRRQGFKIWADATILCGHHGSTVYQIQ